MTISRFTASSDAALHLFVGVTAFTVLVAIGVANALLARKGLAQLVLPVDVRGLLQAAVIYVVSAFRTPPGSTTTTAPAVAASVPLEQPSATVNPTETATSVHVLGA